jgi:hypothetical protein
MSLIRVKPRVPAMLPTEQYSYRQLRQAKLRDGDSRLSLVWSFTSNARRKNGKKVYKWKPMLRRPLGRPKNRREDDIRNDIKKL